MKTVHLYIQTLFATLLSLGLLFVVAGTASAHTAHAKVLSATPAIGSTITQAPDKVTCDSKIRTENTNQVFIRYVSFFVHICIIESTRLNN